MANTSRIQVLTTKSIEASVEVSDDDLKDFLEDWVVVRKITRDTYQGVEVTGVVFQIRKKMKFVNTEEVVKFT